MMSPPIISLPVEGMGEFQVRRITPRLRFAAERSYEELCRGTDGKPIQGQLLKRAMQIIALLETLVVQAPDSFDLATMDPADPLCMAQLIIVEDAILAEDARFRGRAWPPSEASGPAAQPDHGVSLPPQIQPAAQ